MIIVSLIIGDTMKNKVLLVYPGLGKTYCAQIMNNVLEIQLNHYKNLNVRKLGTHFPEHLKGNFEPAMELDSNFPNNVLDAINQGFRQDKTIVMALKNSNIDFLIEKNIDFVFVMPSKNKVAELKNQYISRGNTEQYIERNIDGLEQVLTEIKKHNKPIYYIEKGCHLSDFIISSN